MCPSSFWLSTAVHVDKFRMMLFASRRGRGEAYHQSFTRPQPLPSLSLESHLSCPNPPPSHHFVLPRSSVLLNLQFPLRHGSSSQRFNHGCPCCQVRRVLLLCLFHFWKEGSLWRFLQCRRLQGSSHACRGLDCHC